jgi:hypothetical protein
MMSDPRLLPYVVLMTNVASGVISLTEFASSYIALFQEEKETYDEDVFDVLNSVFLDSDEYTPSTDTNHNSLKSQFPNFVIGDDEFMERIKDALEKMA